ncbi:MAG TPA: class I SAM-dependent methyltransferase [Clostridia bacterium]|nr:class I SAM-dependent methyltransferase [Clostridia bacterium]
MKNTDKNSWDFSNNKELQMHSVHAYPAKFPAFIATKAFDFASSKGVKVNSVADVFCGCGTVSLEAKMHGIKFWGCDINPVATLITRAKSATYDTEKFSSFCKKIESFFKNSEISSAQYEQANERLKYWFDESTYLDLFRLKMSIERVVFSEKYLDAFLCIFSSLLKAVSRWLAKSIKPQIDPNKKHIAVWDVFHSQCKKFKLAIEQVNLQNPKAVDINIVTGNFLEMRNIPFVDLIITSPPYVTSYEYADLHQLSSLWLQYTDDYRSLRKGSIGSMYNSEEYTIDLSKLNQTGRDIIFALGKKQKTNSKVRSIARYYSDIQDSIEKCAGMLNQGGMALFVVGDTEYKSVKIKNSEHLIHSMQDAGFINIEKEKRKISQKRLTPYRDKFGKFTSDKAKRKVYHEEYVISGRIQ